MASKEHYNGRPLGVNAAAQCGVAIAGFLASTAGTITVTDADGTVLVNAAPVVTGIFIRIPLVSRSNAGMSVQLAGGASGTLFG